VGPLPIGLLLQENLSNCYKKEKQMTVVTKSLTGASFAKDLDWEAIDWPTVRKQVKQIQMRIAKAIRERKRKTGSN
jgi:hypothetical protein